MEKENNNSKTLNCHFCKKEIKPNDHIIIDENNFIYCTDKHLFYDYGQEEVWRKYRMRKDKTNNYIDLGLMDIKYSGSYDRSCNKYLEEGGQ